MSSRTRAASEAWTVDVPLEAMAGAHVRRQQLVPLFEHGRAEGRALRERQPLPGAVEDRIVLAEQPLQGAVQVFEIC